MPGRAAGLHTHRAADRHIRQATKKDYDQILTSIDAFWDERISDARVALFHHALFVHELGDTAFVVEDLGGTITAYLFGFFSTTATVAYVHVIAVRATHRRLGLATALYRHLAGVAMGRGAHSIKAITTPGNEASIAFHASLGMSATEVANYAGPGQHRVVLLAGLEELQKCPTAS